MASASEVFRELADPPASFKSVVWDYFGFHMDYNGDRDRVVDSMKMVCRYCWAEIRYVKGNTSNMLTHAKRHHPDLELTGGRKKLMEKKKQLITSSFNVKGKLGKTSDRAKKITEAICIYIATSMRPYKLVDEAGFKYLLQVLEPRYELSSRSHISSTVVPAIYRRTHKVIEDEISAAVAVALTTDNWTSCATESYVTVAAHFLNSEWDIQLRVYEELMIPEVLSRAEQQAETRETTEASPSISSQAEVSTSSSYQAEAPPLQMTAESDRASSPLPKRRSTMAELFGPLFKTGKRSEPDLKQRLKDEVYAHMALDCIDTDADPLVWWQTHESLYPNLAKLARCYLAVSATSVASERVFSTAGDIVTSSRSALT